jgi:hypothetical protein
MKTDGHFGRDFLKSHHGDRISAVICGAGQDFRLFLNWLRHLLHLILEMLAALLAGRR